MTFRSWRHGVEMDFDILEWQDKSSKNRILVVKVWGKYKPPMTGIEGNHLLNMAVAAAIAWSRRSDIRLVIDLSGLDYSYGDRLFTWKGVLKRFGATNENSRVALVCSDQNKHQIQSLLREEEDQQNLNACFDNLEDAILSLNTDKPSRSQEIS
jgi:hypothetical protein